MWLLEATGKSWEESSCWWTYCSSWTVWERWRRVERDHATAGWETRHVLQMCWSYSGKKKIKNFLPHSGYWCLICCRLLIILKQWYDTQLIFLQDEQYSRKERIKCLEIVLLFWSPLYVCLAESPGFRASAWTAVSLDVLMFPQSSRVSPSATQNDGVEKRNCSMWVIHRDGVV